MTCFTDLSKLPYGKRYLIPMATSTAALLFMLVASYSCKFVRVTRDDDENGVSFSPFFFGIWKAEGELVAGEGFLGNTNQCIAWTDTSMFRDGGIRAAKFFTIFSTFGGTAIWLVVLTSAFRPVGQTVRFLLLIGPCFCALLNIMFFCAFAAQVCDDESELHCRMGAASYLTLTATVLWMTSAVLSFAFTDTDDDNAPIRDLVTVETTHTSPTIPTGSGAPRSRPYRYVSSATTTRPPTIKEAYHESHPDLERTSSNKSHSSSNKTSSPARSDDPWYNDPQRRTSTPVDLDEEVGVDDMPLSGSPLISITEDDRGNLVKTTITRTVDSQGRTIIDRTSQVIEDIDKAETASV